MIHLRLAGPTGLGGRPIYCRESEALSLAFLLLKKTLNKFETSMRYAFMLALSVMFTGTF